METAKLYSACAFAAGLVITLFLAAYLTPRGWWRRPNARALLIMVGGAWAIGSVILYAAPGKPAMAAGTSGATDGGGAEVADGSTAAAAALARRDPPIAGRPFQVHRALNLRATAGVDAPRLITVPAGATVTPTGMRSGDWWQIKASVAGRESTGWVSSLWLRRSGE
ncbi:SH3 domain-containing protein [Duganella aceris]|uniref:SH3 domain-containing protein n=1 Tax=Duganella aceris TaxID=2703883 RepID=A0ABX0FGC2_9BURK|nr:SH3 domain-containing protein [Duganella aceris]NGZ83542.1 SH3 domain-containing protein [Duganella aceris]